jgi:hypothetical protein
LSFGVPGWPQPNMTFGQPPFYAHKMIADTLQPNAVKWSMASSDNYNATNLNGMCARAENGESVSI